MGCLLTRRTCVLGLGLNLGAALALQPGLAATDAPGITASEILLGGVFALSGPVRLVTEPYEAAIRAVFDQVNAAGGLRGRKLRWQVEDDAYQPSRTLASAKKLVERDRVFVVFGHMGTPTALAVAPYLAQRKIPFFPLTTLPDGAAHPFTYGFQSNYDRMMFLVARHLAARPDISRIGYLYQNDDLGEGVRGGIVRALEQAGKPLVADVGYERGTADFSTQVLKLRDAMLDAVISIAPAPSVATGIKQALLVGFKPVWATYNGGGSAVMPKLLGSAVDGLVFASEVDQQLSDPVPAEAFRAATQGRLGEAPPDAPPDWAALIGYAQARFIVDCLTELGDDLTRDALGNLLAQNRTFDVGVMAPVSYGGKSSAANAIKIFVWKDSRPDALTGWLPLYGQAAYDAH